MFLKLIKLFYFGLLNQKKKKKLPNLVPRLDYSKQNETLSPGVRKELYL